MKPRLLADRPGLRFSVEAGPYSATLLLSALMPERKSQLPRLLPQRTRSTLEELFKFYNCRLCLRVLTEFRQIELGPDFTNALLLCVFWHLDDLRVCRPRSDIRRLNSNVRLEPPPARGAQAVKNGTVPRARVDLYQAGST